MKIFIYSLLLAVLIFVLGAMVSFKLFNDVNKASNSYAKYLIEQGL